MQSIAQPAQNHSTDLNLGVILIYSFSKKYEEEVSCVVGISQNLHSP